VCRNELVLEDEALPLIVWDEGLVEVRVTEGVATLETRCSGGGRTTGVEAVVTKGTGTKVDGRKESCTARGDAA
jgi:hypothetical protein